MERDEQFRYLQQEAEALIRLHQQGLSYTGGYRERKQKMLDYIRDNRIDVAKELDPLALVLFRRYFEGS